jgi:Fur family ferric uptake transcriptional regulator
MTAGTRGNAVRADQATDAAALVEECQRVVRAAGGRSTPGRRRVVRVLAEAGGHLGVGEIHRRIAETGAALDASTVYRALERLQALGLIHAVALSGGVESSYGLAGPPHHHLLCENCRSITEVPAAVGAEAIARAREAAGFDTRSLVFSGVCAACSAQDV